MFGVYLELGFEHILDPGGLDHVLFLVALTLIYKLTEWKTVVILATAFTLGHSLTLALSALGVFIADSRIVEILIALSIAITALFSMFTGASDNRTSYGIRYAIAFFFGLVHGLGFSGYFKSILGSDDIILPLVSFNIGVELAQVVIVMVSLLINHFIYLLSAKGYKLWRLLLPGVILAWSIILISERL